MRGKDGAVRGAVMRVVQRENGKLGLIKRPLQLLIPLEVKEPDEQSKENEDSLKTKPKRMAATNADIIRKLCS